MSAEQTKIDFTNNRPPTMSERLPPAVREAHAATERAQVANLQRRVANLERDLEEALREANRAHERRDALDAEWKAHRATHARMLEMRNRAREARDELVSVRERTLIDAADRLDALQRQPHDVAKWLRKLAREGAGG